MPKETASAVTALVIPEAKMMTASIGIVGFAPLVLNRFGEKQRRMMEEAHKEGGSSQKRGRAKIREPRDFDDDYNNAQYLTTEGVCGIPAASFRNAMISACKVCGFAMTRAKLSIFVEADGFDKVDGTPLVKITKGDPQPWMAPVRNATGVADLRCRPQWREGWEANLNLSWDSQQFGVNDVMNLLARAGLQVGVGEGRPDSKQSNGLGFGRWKINGSVADVTVTKVN